MGWITRYAALADRVSEGVGRAVSWLGLAMIGVLMFEVAARYLFNSPTAWAHESTTMLYGTLCVLAGAYTHRHHGHVRSEVIYNLFPRRGRALLDVITGLIGLVVFSVFLVVAFNFAWDSWQMQEVSSKSTWGPPLWPFKAMLPLGVALMILQSLAHLLRDLLVLFGGELPGAAFYAPAPEDTAAPASR